MSIEQARPQKGRWLISRRQLRQRIPVSDMTIYRWEKQGLFPRHISINGRNYWDGNEVEREIASRFADINTAEETAQNALNGGVDPIIAEDIEASQSDDAETDDDELEASGAP